MNQKPRAASRRRFLKQTGAALATFTIASPDILGGNRTPPSEKLNCAFIGVGGRGRANLNGLSKNNNVVALCDVDDKRAGKAFEHFKDAKRFKDFRKMFDALEKSIDVVAVSTPDHTHAIAAMAAIERKKHVYCEKPLAHSVHEVRELMKAARENKVVTQLGNQGHSSRDIRKCVEWVRDGAIGNVHTVHAACSAVHCRIADLKKRTEPHAIPKELDWDLWLGPAVHRSFHPMYIRGAWRAWRPFGNGTIGDWVCHVVDPSFWALDLGLPSSVEALKQGDFDPGIHLDTFSRGSVLRFEFPAKEKRGAVTMYWYSGEERIPRPQGSDRDPPKTGAVLIGDKGIIQHGSHGAGGVRIVPDAKMKAYKQPAETIRRVPSHHADFLMAIKEGRKAGSDFAEYGGPLTEIAMLGVISQNFPGKKLEWDAEAARFTNCDEANAFVQPPYRAGWTLRS
ncbi:MAG: Gfo/Idh/MocA family oxidoreductase [Planctomycetota bacterium]